ncbi:MAG: WD40/YVTN/BNR-like repeat-containing protein, partial [Clostridia bacterium]
MADRLQQLATMRWRNIGPHRGGRSVAVVGHPTEPLTFYFGATGGGVYKTINGGVTWTNISDGYVNTASVGAVAIAQSDPNVMYVGMGEACIRGNVSFGDGVYRSNDGGRTWSHRGLADTRHISRVRIHPANPDVAYVAALGHAFGPNSDRGVFRTQDGGQHWEKVLFVSENTGAIDLNMDPTNPRILFASMWHGQRSPWGFVSGGAESALYVSRDGGDGWQRLGEEQGFPSVVLGRIGVAVSPARPDRVWAMVEAKDEHGGLYRSDDGGRHFQQIDHSRGPRSRPWYYTHMFADPVDENTCYILSAGYYKSIDGGKSFSRISTPHGDHHDLWIDPKNPKRQIHGADGGAVVTFDGGASWSSIHNQATSEFYHVTTDTRFPYRVYGAQQDNSTITVPSASHYPALTDREWYEIGGAESGYIQVDPRNPDIVYAGSSGGGEGGRLTRYDHATKQLRDISVYPEKTAGVAAEAYTYRFQWTSPIHISPHDPNVLYMCSNHVHRSHDEGQTWEVVSPDLTRNDPEKLKPSGGPITLDQTGVEIYGTVFAFQESPVQAGVLWAGSDDGLIHRSTDNGRTWTEVTPKNLPEWTLISIIEPSHRDADTAYVAANRYKLDDPKPYLLKTTDGGSSWTFITEGIPADEYTRVIREDPTMPGLLYCGTERGAYVSFDDGLHWESLKFNLPVVPVHDLEVKDTDLVAATHGRSFWVLDDLTPVRALAGGSGSHATRLFPLRDTVRSTAVGRNQWIRRMGEGPLPVHVAGSYMADRPETGDPAGWLDAGTNVPAVIVQYYLAEEPERISLTFKDASGATVKVLSSDELAKGDAGPRLKKTAGSHRVVWDATYPGATRIEEPGSEWPSCAPTA